MNSILSVQEISSLIQKRLLVPELMNAVVEGEITQYQRHAPSGHIYFTLRDKDGKVAVSSARKAVLRCTFFKGANNSMHFEPKVGDEVQVFGSINVYFPQGQYNFNVKRLEKVGAGNLLLKIQNLRKKLIEEGIINPSQRKTFPVLPRKIGIITGAQSAALTDIQKQILERYPNVNILLAPALVQGNEAANSICTALQEISKSKYGCELIILSRGGGSTEDLMPFNEEEVARAIYECPIPVVSGVGHEIDHSICDDVADLQAATPTDAAKKVLPIIYEFEMSLNSIGNRLGNYIEKELNYLKEKLKRVSERNFYRDPRLLLEDYHHRLDELEMNITKSFKEKLNSLKEKLKSLPDIYYLLEGYLSRKTIAYTKEKEKLQAFSPLATLKRGYSITRQEGRLIRSVQEINKNKEIQIKLSQGEFYAKFSSLKNSD